MMKKGATTDRLLRFIGVLASRRFPTPVPVLAQAAGISRATAYRYVAALERLGALPLKTVGDGRRGDARAVCVDWKRLRGCPDGD